MAVLDAIKNQVVGRVARALTSNLIGIRGNLPSRARKGPKPSNTSGREAAEARGINLSYPLNVEEDEQEGHYIMFMINETKQGKIGKGNRAGVKEGILEDDAGDFGDVVARSFQGKKFIIDEQFNQGAGGAQATMAGSKAAGSQWLTVKRKPTTRMAQAISLYMPPSVKVSYKSNYKDDEIGFVASGLAAAGTSAIAAFTQAGGSLGDQILAAVKGGAMPLAEGTAAFAADKIMRLAEVSAPGSTTLAQLSAGSILGSKMEVMFTGVGRRNFSFTFNFIPKSEQEARMVYNIVQTFKEHMLPVYQTSIDLGKTIGGFAAGLGASSLASGKLWSTQGRILTIPDTFDIFYFYRNNENPFLNRISTCYLNQMDIDYGGDKYVTYEPTTLNGQYAPPPQRTAITLSFTEIETITRERAKQGF
jgi:hypothetical protein